MFAKLWKDEAGVISVEYLFLVTIVGLGMVIGFSNLSDGLNAEYSELANAILGLSQAYSVNSKSGCSSFKQGSNVTDTPQTVTFTGSTVAPTSIDVAACTSP